MEGNMSDSGGVPHLVFCDTSQRFFVVVFLDIYGEAKLLLGGELQGGIIYSMGTYGGGTLTL